MSPIVETRHAPLGNPDALGDARSRGREVAAQFEGLLFAQALAPLADSCGLLGGTVVDLVATGVARRDGGALGASLARAIESARPDGQIR